MRKSVCLFFFSLCLTFFVGAQKGQLGITFSAFSNNEVARFKSNIVDDSNLEAGKSFTYGFTYLQPFNKWLELETGLEYRSCPVEKKSILYDPVRGLSPSTVSGTMTLLSAPISVRANFLHYFFVNAGFLLDLDVSSNSFVDSQSGLGALFGVGLKYDFKNGVSVFANPTIKVHSFPLSFSQSKENFIESAVRFGIAYKL